jgi:pimeloyl-ACP methyl ester carboxylesterase
VPALRLDLGLTDRDGAPAIERHTVAFSGGTLALVLHVPATGPAPCVVACHGLSASKDSDKYLLLGAEMPAAGLAFARFDFRGCGESSGFEANTTVASRIEDLDMILAHLDSHPALDGRFGLLGSSLGGFVALWAAAERPGLPVVTWNAPARLTELANDDLEERQGLGAPFAREFSTGRYAQAPAGISDHLVIHGSADDVVPLEHGVALHAQAAPPGDLVVIPGGDHRLTDPAHRHHAVDRSREWFRRAFRAAR